MRIDTSVNLDGLAVLYVWQSEYPWDVRTEKVCKALSDAGARVHLAACNRRWESTEERLPEALTHRMSPWRWVGRGLDRALQFPAFFNPRWIALLAGVMHRDRPHVIVVRDLPLCPTALWIGRRFGVPVVFDMAENYPAITQDLWDAGRQRRFDFLVRNPRFVAAVEDYCIHRVDHTLVVVEECAAGLATRGVSRDRIDIVSNTPPASRASAHGERPVKAARERVEIVYLGILEIVRGVQELIGAVRVLRDHSVRVRATIVGGGRDMDLFRQRARELGLTDEDVVFKGHLDHAAALDVVAAADIGVVPTRRTAHADSTVPNKLFDYMAAALPVVTSDTVPCARIVRETDTGEVFRAGDAADLAAAIGRLVEDPARRYAMGEHGREAIRTRYNWEQDSAVLTRVIGRVTRQRRTAVASAVEWRRNPAT